MERPYFPPKQGLYDPQFEKESCGVCHHVYDEEQKKLIAADGMEAMCADCHELKKKGNTLGLRKAYHGSCNKCHRKLKKEGKPAGPTTCGECHKK